MSKTVLVFGSSRGIGYELTKQFVAEGYQVHGFSRTQQETHPDINLHLHTLDLSSTSLKSDVEELLSTLTTIDYVVYNAGNIVVKPFLELTKEDIASCYQVNVIAAMEVLQVCLPKMKKTGHVVMISSMGGFQGSMKFAGLSAYSPSKAALCSLTELLAEEFKETGISINCLCLGAVQTEMLEEAFPGYQAPHSANEMASFIKDFTIHQGAYFKGKILPVSISTP